MGADTHGYPRIPTDTLHKIERIPRQRVGTRRHSSGGHGGGARPVAVANTGIGCRARPPVVSSMRSLVWSCWWWSWCHCVPVVSVVLFDGRVGVWGGRGPFVPAWQGSLMTREALRHACLGSSDEAASVHRPGAPAVFFGPRGARGLRARGAWRGGKYAIFFLGGRSSASRVLVWRKENLIKNPALWPPGQSLYSPRALNDMSRCSALTCHNSRCVFDRVILCTA